MVPREIGERGVFCFAALGREPGDFFLCFPLTRPRATTSKFTFSFLAGSLLFFFGWATLQQLVFIFPFFYQHITSLKAEPQMNIGGAVDVEGCGF